MKRRKNISEKNPNFGEYTFHYNLWKNNIIEKDYNEWIGFQLTEDFGLKMLKKKFPCSNIIKWNNYDVFMNL